MSMHIKRKCSAIAVVFVLFLSLNSCQKEEPAVTATVKSVDERVEELLGQMTLDEKVGQMTQAERSALKSIYDIKTYFLGSLLSGGGSAPANNQASSWADMVDAYQAVAVQTRLKIPIIYGIDAVHGNNNVKGAVIFPQ
ncbi:MAG: hypothetical protein KA247_02420, partial [Bacteroidetes bacterium]|nr:hypothetical protein [Bacteroidota bacterium]